MHCKKILQNKACTFRKSTRALADTRQVDVAAAAAGVHIIYDIYLTI